MPLHVRVSGSWKNVNVPAVRVGGVWKAVKKVYVRVGGVWKKAYGAVPQLTGLIDPLISFVVGLGGNRPVVSVRFNTDGTMERASGHTGAALNYISSGDWLDAVPPATPGDWEVRWDVTSEDAGGTWSGSTREVFIGLGSQRTFTWTKDTNGQGIVNSDVTITLREIADTGNSASRSAMTHTCQIEP